MFDLIAYAVTALCIFATRKWIISYCQVIPGGIKMFYFIIATTGVMIGSVFFGSLNLFVMGEQPWLAKSVLGGLVGGIFAVELMKLRLNIVGSTGAILVIGLCFGIAIGRIGCFLSGLSDHTHGVRTESFLGVDYGDGLNRFPVELYEAAFMFFVGIACFVKFITNKTWMLRYGFYVFCAAYALQRFNWEFLKPYPEIFMNMNIFQFLCIALFIYALVMIKTTHMSAEVNYESATRS